MALIQRYVDEVNGDNNNNGQTELTAWKDFPYALSRLNVFDTNIDSVELIVLDHADKNTTNKGYRGEPTLTASGTAQNRITIKNQVGHTPKIGGQLNPTGVDTNFTVVGNYITLEGLRVCFPSDEVPIVSDDSNRMTNLRISGVSCIVNNCDTSADDLWENLMPDGSFTGPHINGIVVPGSNNIIRNHKSDNLTRSAYLIQGFKNHIEFSTCERSKTEIVIYGGMADNAEQGHSIEFCSFRNSGDEDSIQSNNSNLNTPDIDFNGLVVKFSELAVNLENGVDHKGARRLLVENCLIHSCGAAGIVRGNGGGDAEQIIIRNNIVFSNLSGMRMVDRYVRVYHNIFWCNYTNKSGLAYTTNIFPNTRFGGFVDARGSSTNGIKNNIIANTANNTDYLSQECVEFLIDRDVSLVPPGNMTNADKVDNNIYYLDSAIKTGGARFCIGRGALSSVTYYDLAGWKTRTGYDTNSVEADPQIVNFPLNPDYDKPSLRNYDISLSPTSPAKDNAIELTTATTAGVNSTQLQVDDAYWFCDKFGYDNHREYIVLGSNIVEVIGIDYTNNMLTLATPQTWAANENVLWSPSTSNQAKDIGVIGWIPVGDTQDLINYSSGQAPEINPQSFTINEKVSIGTVVGQIVYNDFGSTITVWSLDTNVFSVDGQGVITTNQEIDYSVIGSNISFNVTATNSNNQSTTEVITVNINNLPNANSSDGFYGSLKASILDLTSRINYVFTGITVSGSKTLKLYAHCPINDDGVEVEAVITDNNSNIIAQGTFNQVSTTNQFKLIVDTNVVINSSTLNVELKPLANTSGDSFFYADALRLTLE